MQKWKMRLLSGLLCLGLLAGNLPTLALDFHGLGLTDRRVEQLKDACSGDYALDPDTARSYLAVIEQRERELAALPYDASPLDVRLIDLDGDGDGELYLYDENPTPENVDMGIIYGVGAICSAEGTVLSFGGGAGSHAQPCTVLIAPPYVGVFYGEAANSMAMGHAEATLYRFENGNLKALQEWFFDFRPLINSYLTADNPSDSFSATISYTDVSGQVITQTASWSDYISGTLSVIDPLAQIIEGGEAYGADLSRPLISTSGDGYYVNAISTEQIKSTLQSVLAAADRGDLLNPGDPVFQDIAGTVAVWDSIFSNEPFDITRGQPPLAEPLFDWWSGITTSYGTDGNTPVPVASDEDPDALKAFFQTLEPESADLAADLFAGGDWMLPGSFSIYQTEDEALHGVLRELFGPEFDPNAIYERFETFGFVPLLGKDGHWYATSVMSAMGGYSYTAPVSAVASLGDGLYIAYLTGLYQDIGLSYDGQYHMILQTAPTGSSLPYRILSLGEGAPSDVELSALKARVLASNTQYNYEKIASFQNKEDYLNYLEEQLSALNGQSINDKGQLETAQYLQFLYENAVVSPLSAKGNRLVIGQKQLESAVAQSSDLQAQVQAVLEQYGVTLNRSLQVTLKVLTPKLDWEKRVEVELQPDVRNALSGIHTLRVVLDGSGMGFSIQTDTLPDDGPVRFSIRCQDGAYALVFQDASGTELSQSPVPLTLFLPAQSPLASVEVQYGEQFDNWGGQYDGNNSLIFFSTNWSGIYQVAENAVELTDIGDLTEDEQRIIRFMVSRGFFSAPDGQFNPAASLSRYEFATALVGMFYALDRQAACTFTDVSQDNPYYAHIASAQQAGIAAGIGGDLFDGTRAVSREEVLTFCSTTLVDKKGYQLPDNLAAYANFTDRSSISQWALSYVALAEQLGVVDGGGALEPQGTVSRAEGAQLLYKLFMLLYEVSPAQAALYEQTAQADFSSPAAAICFASAAASAALGAILLLTKWGKKYSGRLSPAKRKAAAAAVGVLVAILLGAGAVLMARDTSSAASSGGNASASLSAQPAAAHTAREQGNLPRRL